MKKSSANISYFHQFYSKACVEGEIEKLLYEGQTIQEKLNSPDSSMAIANILIKFRFLMSKDNVNGALKLLADNMLNGILPLADATLQLLKQKLPGSREPPPEVLIEGPIRKIHHEGSLR